MRLFRYNVFFIFIIGYTFIHPCNIYAGPGDCSHIHDYKISESGGANNRRSFVNRENAPVYQSATSDEIVTHLDFNDRVFLYKYFNNRLSIDKDGKIFGWMDPEHLLCAQKPLKTHGKSGIEKKFVVMSKSQARKKNQPHVFPDAYPDPTSKSCNNKCRTLTRFKSYFIFDESDTRYLISPAYRLETGKNLLMGWVDKTAGYVWNTALALRPDDDLPDTAPVFAYLDNKDATNRTNGRPILGGKRWFTDDIRIPIIDRTKVDNFYKIIIPVPGVGVNKVSDNKFIIPAINPEKFSNPNSGIDAIKRLTQNLDVFFLIDGTRSMGPHIDIVSETIKDISNRLIQQISLDSTSLRMGFGIYRDHYAKNHELGDWFHFPRNCQLNPDELQQNLDAFYRKLNFYNKNTYGDASKGDRDFEENMFGGIKKAIREFARCPDHSKVLFVIGDHGYSAENQKRFYNKRPVTIDSLADGLKENVNLFFIQVAPSEKIRNANFDDISYAKKESARVGYDRAYQLFTTQAKDLLQRVRNFHQSTRFDMDDHFFEITDYQLSESIVDQIHVFSELVPEIGNEIAISLTGGESLVRVIERLLQNKKYRNVPGLFWDIIQEAGCENLGEQCKNSVIDTTLFGFIPDENLAIDAWCHAQDLEKYLNILRDINAVGEISGNALRTQLVSGMMETLARYIINPSYNATDDETMSEYLERASTLPVRLESPLFHYKHAQLTDRNQVPDCVIEAMNSWIGNAITLLKVVKKNRQPQYIFEKNTICKNADNIPILKEITSEPFPEEDMSYSYANDETNTTIYWIPAEYLP